MYLPMRPLKAVMLKRKLSFTQTLPHPRPRRWRVHNDLNHRLHYGNPQGLSGSSTDWGRYASAAARVASSLEWFDRDRWTPRADVGSCLFWFIFP